MRLASAFRLGCFSLLACSFTLRGQAPNTPPPPTQPGYTLHIASRIVLTDVTVTDKQGNPVRGLDRSGFHIFDNDRPQQIGSFTEHTGADNPAIAPDDPGIFSNNYLQHPPAVFNVLLLDTTTIHILDQMYLAQQLEKFIDALPPGQPLAIYTRAGDLVVMLQDFTSDHGLLKAALRKGIPYLRQPGSWYASDLSTLGQMVSYLGRYPGRKNLLWFSGGSNLALMVDAGGFMPYVNMRPLYDQLEATRVAVYPVDARGLTVSFGRGMIYQHMMMQETAEATGGEAFYNNNGLRQVAAKIVNDGSDFYTLTYTPPDQVFDNKWHKVKVEVENRSYQLSYRRGYFNDGSNLTTPQGSRKVLTADAGGAARRPGPFSQPILFEASVVPAAIPGSGAAPLPAGSAVLPPPKKNQATYEIRYILPANAFTGRSTERGPQLMVGTGVLGVNRLGALLTREISTERVTLNADQLRTRPDGTFSFDQPINLPKGDEFLTLVVWDEATGRFGSVQVPVTVPKHAH